jgi:regulator of sigma E protease
MIMVAGVTMNMILGFVVLVGLSYGAGEAIIRTRVVGGVHDIPAAPQLTQRITPGDTIMAVDGAPVHTWNDVLAAFDTSKGNAIAIRTQRETVSIPVGGAAGVQRDQLGYAIQPYFPPVIDQVLPDSPADRAGLRGGDSVVAVGAEPVQTWAQIVDRIEASPGKSLSFTVARDGARVTLSIRPDSTPQLNPATGRKEVVGKIGAQARAATEREPVSVGHAITTGWKQTWGIAGSVVGAVRDLVTGQLSVRQLNGPIAIGRASATAAKRGWDSLLYLIALLSINVAVFNLLPIPILDGGQIVVNVVESAKGSALSTRTREYLIRFGLAAIALLFVIVLYNDITNWVKNLFGL